jgi:nitrous oxidase accessory protein NosD
LAAVPARGNIGVRGNRAASGVLTALVCALIALAAIPAVASARPINVDSIGDQAGAGRCAESAPAGECTLRAAIEASNTDVTFDQIQFNGVIGAELEPESKLPAITEPVYVSGSLEEGPSYYAPEVGITAPSGAAALTVEADDVIVEGLALGGGTAGIEVVGESTGLLALGNWLGLKPDTEANGSTLAGIVLGPGSDGAEIGNKEDEATRRNVFGDDEVGVLIEGASETKVLGNYIGVGPDGSGPATLGVGVRIVDGPAAPAEHNEVGGTLSKGEAESTVCDGPCNVIATEGGIDIDLTGEAAEPASGPTTIRGNYLGLVADGLSPVGENSSGVVADPGQFPCGGGPGDVTVGGTAPTESNYIDAGSFGIFAEGAENFRALGNSIGLLADGSPGESPIAFGIEVCAEGVTEPAQISNNDVLLGPGAIAGIVSEWGRAEISGNTIHGGQAGVLTAADSEGHGDLIKGNIVTAPEVDGIQIQSQSNTLIGNVISGAGQAGIDLEEADLNRVGGDLPGEANSIGGSGVGAILISGSAATRDELRGNTGSGNAGPFIQLLEGEPGERPNAAVEPPTFTTALQSSATGTAKPDSTVRIFSKASAEAGELASLLAVVHADATTGVWSATYATVPLGTLVAATETSGEGATSEVSEPSSASADPVKPVEPEEHAAGNGSSSSSGASSSNPPISPKPPKVKITKHPVKTSKSTIATFKFMAIPAAGARFQCKLDAAKWASCRSPKTYKHLKPRKHTFQVRATASGLTGPAAKFKFTVKR